MNKPLHLAVFALAAPLMLSSCGGGGAEPVQLRQQAAVRSFAPAPQSLVFAGPRSDYAIAKTASGYTVTSKADASAMVTVPSSARLRFSDISVALDIDGVAGQAYRVYQAAFGRTPDVGGLSYWMAVMDKGVPVDVIADTFANSPEFKALYGAAPTNSEVVARLYQNVLHREGETGGFQYWLNVLDKNLANVAQVLKSFSESPENKDGVLPTTRLGIAYQEAGVTYTQDSSAKGLTFTTTAMAATGAEAITSYNEQGAKGYAYVAGIGSYSAWSADLYVKGPAANYTYQMATVTSLDAAARLALWEQWGAKGYLFKNGSVYSSDVSTVHDIFVKTSARGTTYSYRLLPETFSVDKLNVQGAQGYAFRGQIVIAAAVYSIYMKDNGSDAIFNYALKESRSLNDGLLKQMNDMGAQGYGFLGEIFVNNASNTFYARSNASPAPFTYSTAPVVNASAQAVVNEFNAKAANGEVYWGDWSDGASVVSIYYKGGLIVHPLVGPVFP